MDREQLKNLLPERLCALAENAEELRLRRGAYAGVVRCGIESKCPEAGVVTGQDIEEILNRACRFSLHSYDMQLKNGYITASGGIRIGVCGTAGHEGEVLREISSLCIRIPHEVRGCGGLVTHNAAKSRESVIIIAPPGLGKTTLLRELICQTSNLGQRVSVCDERNEIAAMNRGTAGFDLGECSDILCCEDKGKGIMMLLKAMSPQVIAIDEISARQDIEAVLSAAHCGVRLFATAHARDKTEFMQRPLYRALRENEVFTRGIVISMGEKERRYEAVAL